MKNIKLTKKLMMSFLFVTTFAIMMAVIGIWANVSTNNNYTYLLEEPIARHDYLHEMQLLFTMLRYRTANFVMEVDNPDIITDTLTPQFQSAYNEFVTNLNAYINNNNNDHRRSASAIKTNRDNATRLGELVSQFKKEAENTRALALTGDAAAATTNLRNAIPIANEITALFETMTVPATEFVDQESENMDRTARAMTVAQIILAIVCVVFSLAFSIFISGLVGRPIVSMSKILSAIGEKGDLNLSAEDAKYAAESSERLDEIGTLSKTAIGLVNRLTVISDNLAKIADGDLTTNISLLSDRDTIGQAMEKMVENLNSMFGEIQASTAQVTTGSKQIADGAQALAQGSTEQSAAVQQLSSSISEIAQKTKDNAELAGRAASLASTIKDNAEKGSRQMDEMMSAVKEINQASQSINNVISVIDNIAFQTNILALNASVEAARAGQHGKGFAVVAEEVRNLASKSAEAAKDTGVLIANSMKKAELGSRIAGETAASLIDIVSGINESSQIVAEIAKSSDEQSQGISEINKGIDQVAQVVQQNSATAQESAAASEEMSGQADILESLISQFKLAGGGMGGFQKLTPPARALRPSVKDRTPNNPVNHGLGKY